MIDRGINSAQAVRVAKKFNVYTTKEHILKNYKNGDFLFRRKNLDTGRITNYFLHEIYFKKFSMNYSCHKDTKKGKELLISNFEMPRGKVINKKR